MKQLEPKAIKINCESNEYQRLLKCGEDTSTIHAGMVCIEPGKSIGKHNTKSGEEVMIVLEGEGEVLFDSQESLKMETGFLIYCPSFTEHDVKNTGKRILRYIFVISKDH
jgi:quercetin dioxygenase-like cupin family protein